MHKFRVEIYYVCYKEILYLRVNNIKACCSIFSIRQRAYQKKGEFRLKIRIDIVNDKILRDTKTSFAIGNLTVTDRRPASTPSTPHCHLPHPPTLLIRRHFDIHFVKRTYVFFANILYSSLNILTSVNVLASFTLNLGMNSPFYQELYHVTLNVFEYIVIFQYLFL